VIGFWRFFLSKSPIDPDADLGKFGSEFRKGLAAMADIVFSLAVISAKVLPSSG